MLHHMRQHTHSHLKLLSAQDGSVQQLVVAPLALHASAVHWGQAGQGHLYPPTPATSLEGKVSGTRTASVSVAASNQRTSAVVPSCQDGRREVAADSV